MVALDDLRRGGVWIAMGGLLLILRLPLVGLIGWLAGSVLVVAGAMRVRRAFDGEHLAVLTFAAGVAIVAPLLEGMVMLGGQPTAPVSGAAVRVVGALALCWTVARRLDAANRREQARRWSLTFAAQVAIWVPVAVASVAATAWGQPPQVDGLSAMLVFLAGAAPLALLGRAAIPPAQDPTAVPWGSP